VCRPAVVRPRAVGRGLEDVEKVLTDRTAGFVVAFAGVCVNPAARLPLLAAKDGEMVLEDAGERTQEVVALLRARHGWATDDTVGCVGTDSGGQEIAAVVGKVIRRRVVIVNDIGETVQQDRRLGFSGVHVVVVGGLQPGFVAGFLPFRTLGEQGMRRPLALPSCTTLLST
jgi:hypothetical protein